MYNLGPGEALATLLFILGVRLVWGLDYLYATYMKIMGNVSPPTLNPGIMGNHEPYNHGQRLSP